MKIKSVHIYGFGRFVNVRLDNFNDHLQVIYGENEAGKTTLMAFIRAILFGFPTKQESELRYEPKQGTDYGGRLVIETTRHGQVVIERVKGKARGHVTVSFEDGTSGHDELLKDVLEGLDRSMYQAIYSFGLQDMQHLEILQSEEIGSYLYSVGMAGKWNVSKLEKQLDKRQGELFKPSGKKPIMNEQMIELQSLERYRMEKELELEQDGALLQTEAEISAKLMSVREEISGIKKQLSHQERLDILTPLVLKQKELTLQLEKLPDLSTYPHQAMQIFAEFRSQEKKYIEKQTELDYEFTKLQEQISELTVSDALSKAQVDIAELHSNLSSYQEWQLMSEHLTSEHEQKNEQLAEILQRLGTDWNETKLSEAVTTMQAKEELVLLNDEYRTLTERIAYLEGEKNSKEVTVSERKRELERVSAERVSDEKKEQLTRHYQQLLIEETKVKEAMILGQTSPHMTSQQPLLFILLLLLSTGLVFTGLKSYWLVFSMLAIGLVLVLTLFLRKNKMRATNRTANEQQALVRKLHELELEKQKSDAEQGRIQELEQRYHRTYQLYQDVFANYEMILRQMEQLEQKLIDCDEQLYAWCEQAKFVSISHQSFALSVFELVDKGKDLLRVLIQSENQLNQLRIKLTNFEERAKRLGVELIGEINQSIPFIVQKLNEQVKENEQKVLKLKFLQERAVAVEKDKLHATKLLEECREQLARLFKEAQAKTEASFIEKGRFQEEKITLERDLRLVNSQLEAQVSEREQLESLIVEIEDSFTSREEKKRELEEQLNEAESVEKEIEKQLFACQVARKKLANESELAVISQNIEMKKTNLKQHATEWAIHETAKQMIKKAKAIYEEKRQPEVMHAAEMWFEALTCGQYTRVFAPIDESTVTVERHDKVRFLPEELSQGTKEQLYLALRIALAEAYRSKTVFPLIIDDVFVNFDDERKLAVAEVIKKLASKRQVLLFTCHEHIRQLFSTDAQWVLKR